MAESARVGDIEVSQDLDFERRARTTRGVAAVVFGLLLLAGLLGLLGRSGPLSDASAEDGRALRVDYERFLRFKSPTELVFTLGTGRGATRVALAADYLEGFRLSGFSAAPRSTTVAADRTVFTFDQRAPSRP